jgi:4-amino-4-deoxy-L-arabinose transferase-like glycosyltransferase
LRLLRIAGLLLFGYLLLLAATNEDTFRLKYLVVVGLLTGTAAVYIVLRTRSSPGSVRRILLAIVLLGGLARFLWAIYIPTRPVSDFRSYHDRAMEIVQGRIPEELSKNPGYPLLLSLVYRVEPAVVSGKIINAALSTLTIVLVFLLGSALSTPAIGLLSALLFAILPSEINMVSVIGTEVAATALVTAATLALVYGCRSTAQPGWLFASGLLLGAGLLVRSSLLFLAPVLAVYLVFARGFSAAAKLTRLAVFSAGVASSLLALAAWHSLSTHQLNLSAFKSQDAFVFLSGTNIQAEGHFNQEDADLYLSWPAEARDRLAVQEAFRRVAANPAGFLLFIPKKIASLMGDQTYGNKWSIFPINWHILKQLRAQREVIMNVNGYINQSVYILLLGLALFHFIYYRFPAAEISALSILAVVLLLIPHTILEVQSRYHHPVLPFVVLVAGVGLFEAFSASAGRLTSRQR